MAKAFLLFKPRNPSLTIFKIDPFKNVFPAAYLRLYREGILYTVCILGLHRILIGPDIRPIILPDNGYLPGYPARPDTGYPAKINVIQVYKKKKNLIFSPFVSSHSSFVSLQFLNFSD